MNDEAKRAKYQAKRSRNAEKVDAPILIPAERGNLDAIVSLRFSAYELKLLRKESKARSIKLSALIRELVFDGLVNKKLNEKDSVTLDQHPYSLPVGSGFSTWVFNADGVKKDSKIVLQNPLQHLSATQ